MRRITSTTSKVREYNEDGSVKEDTVVVTEGRTDGDVHVERTRYYSDGDLVGKSETTTAPGHVTIRRWDYDGGKFTLITRDDMPLAPEAVQAAQEADRGAHEAEWEEVADLGEIG